MDLRVFVEVVVEVVVEVSWRCRGHVVMCSGGRGVVDGLTKRKISAGRRPIDHVF